MIAIGCDHAAVEMKNAVRDYLTEKGFEMKDLGTNGEPCDYPNMAEKLCGEITSGNCEKGILICGTGIGMSIAADLKPFCGFLRIKQKRFIKNRFYIC